MTARVRLFAAALTALLAMGQTQRNTSMELELKISKTRFILRESLRVDVVVHNRGGTSVEVPAIASNANRALSYHLTGTSFDKEFVFYYAASGAMVRPGPPAMEPLPPGQSMNEPLAIEGYVNNWKPGKHTLYAQLETGGVQLKSNRLEFEILRSTVRSAQVMPEITEAGSGSMRILFMAESAGVNRLYQAFLPEISPDIETSGKGSFNEVFEVPAEATGAVGMWTNFSRSGGMFIPRYGWQSKDSVAVQEMGSPAVMLSAADGTLVRPAMLNQASDALLLRWQGPRAALTRIARGGVPTEVWSAKLPFTPVSGRAFLANELDVSAVFAGEQEGKVVLAVVREGKVRATVKIERAVLLPESEPGFTVGADGSVKASILVSDPADKHLVSSIEWQSGKLVSNVKKGQPFRLAADAVAAAAIYAGGRHEWVILMADGKVVNNYDPTRPRTVYGTPARPLQLLPRKTATFLLATHPDEMVCVNRLF